MSETVNIQDKKKKLSIPKLVAGTAIAVSIIILFVLSLYYMNIINNAPNGYDVEISGSGINIVKYTGNEKVVKIPKTINSRNVISIGKDAFKKNNNIEKVTVPESIRKVEDNAFAECKNLREITFDSEYTFFGKNIFENSSVKKAILPTSLQKISDGMFKNCKSIKQVIFPDNLKEIGNEAFYGCTSIKSMIIGSSVFKIGKDAFGGNSEDFQLSSLMGTETEIYALKNDINYIPCNAAYRPYTMYDIKLGDNHFNSKKVSERNTGILRFHPYEDGYYRITLTSENDDDIKQTSTLESVRYCTSIHNNHNDIIYKFITGDNYFIKINATEEMSYNLHIEKTETTTAKLYKKGENLINGNDKCKLKSGTKLHKEHSNNSETAASVNGDIILTKILDYYVDNNQLWCKINANVGGHGNQDLWFKY